MPLTAGQTLTHYEILGSLGAGAMGEVYRAKDTRLDREVAIKVLPEHFAEDEERLRRFEREAKSLASLNHSNVAQIFGVDLVDDTCFLVLELVPGETLEERLSRGPLPTEEAIDVCRQIAEGLEAAHEAGVIHRDLKPANVRVTPDGKVKVLDFGLAKPTGSDASEESTTDSVLSTEEGRLLGTPTYMAPEQARGKPIDKRVDLWAFGCVLFECLTGRRAFEGETISDVLASVLEKEPEWSALPVPTPGYVRTLLRRCFDKAPRSRLRDVGEARVVLERGELAQESGDVPVSRSGLLLVAGLVLGAGATVLGGRLFRSDPDPERIVALSIPPSTAAYIQASRPRISPDGASVLFSAARQADGVRKLWIRPLGAFDARELPGTDNADDVFWSPDSTSIGFEDDEGVKIMHLEEGAARLLLPGELADGTWSPSGILVYHVPEDGLFTLPVSGGRPERLTELSREHDETGVSAPSFLPDGDAFLFLAAVRSPDRERIQHRLYAGRLSTRETRFLMDFPSRPMCTDDGDVVFVEDGTVRSAPFDAETMRFTAEPRELADGVQFNKYSGDSSMSVARNGTIAFQSPQNGDELVWLDRRGLELGRVGGPGIYRWAQRISPNGESVAVSVGDPRTGLGDIWIFGLTRATATRATEGTYWEGRAVWAPDGRTIYYSTDSRGWPDVEAIDLDPPGEPRLVWGREKYQAPLDVTSDGRRLLAADGEEVWLVPLDGAGDPELVVRGVPHPIGVGGFTGARLSPDDRWVAYAGDVSGELQVYVTGLEERGRTIQVTVDGGYSPEWGPGSGILYFIANRNQLWEVDLSTEEKRASPEPRVLFETGRVFTSFQVDREGERFLLRYRMSENPPISILLQGDE